MLSRPMARAVACAALVCSTSIPVVFAAETVAPRPGDEMPALTYKVTIQNLAATQPMSPPVAATHKQPIGMFRAGTNASPGLEAIAEDGNQLPMFMRLSDPRLATQAVDVGRPLPPSGQEFMGLTDSATFTIEARPFDRLSLATMLICTNDGFTGLDRAKLPLRGSRIYLTQGYDAGTEDNTELSMDIVDACSALGPVTLDGDPNGNLDAPVDTSPREPIRHHPGVFEVGDLLSAHNWTGPVAKVTVTRIAEHARAFVARLSGAGEVPALESTARGRAHFSFAGEDEEAPRYMLAVDDLEDVVQAHIHYGSPAENGPVVAFLYGPAAPAGFVDGLLAHGSLEEGDLVGPFENDLAGFVAALRAGDLYVNVHTTAHPSGELRGQIGAGIGARERLLPLSRVEPRATRR